MSMGPRNVSAYDIHVCHAPLQQRQRHELPFIGQLSDVEEERRVRHFGTPEYAQIGLV
jgi:hypothetical protein